jgi:hypothetical protein
LKKLLYVAKDPGAANVTLPVAIELTGEFQQFAAVEGVAGGLYARSGIPFNFVRGLPEEMIRHVRPHAVICGLSHPIGMEERYGRAANRLGIPLVHSEDFWGGHVRSRARPDVIGCIDEYGCNLARQKYPHALIILSGSPGVRSSVVVPDLRVVELVQQYRGRGTTIVVPLSIDLDMPRMLAQSLALSTDCVVLARMHPKCIGARVPGMRVTYEAYYRALLAPHGEKVVWMHESLDDVIAASDALIAGYSTTMFTAIQQGKMVASLWTPEIKSMVKVTGGIDTLPWFAEGMPFTEVPCDLKRLLRPLPPTLKERLHPFDAAPLVQVIRSL